MCIRLTPSLDDRNSSSRRGPGGSRLEDACFASEGFSSAGLGISTVGLDLAKYIFQLHGADSAGAVVFRQKLRRGQLLAFLATLPPCTVAMEACASAHYWGREIAKLGHTVKLIAPAYVKPFVKRQKND